MKIKSSKVFKILAIALCFFMAFEQSGFAQVAGQLDISGHLAAFSNSLVQDKFRPLHLRYLQYDPQLNNFKLLLDKGNTKKLSNAFVEESTKTLLQYFLVGISLPNDAFWVNLRPDSPDNVIDPLLGQTDVGKILLEADVQLKKDTAKFTSPETPEGKEYWDKLYEKAGEIFGSQNVTIPTLTRPWIVPDEIILRETNDNAYVYKATLKVMLEDDYLKGSAVYNFDDPRLKELNTYASSVLREKIIPKLTQEVNASKKYAALRQVYYSLILAQWFKQRFNGKGGRYASLINRQNLNGLISKGSWSKNTYFQQYQKSFKDGEYNFKVPMSTPYGQVIRSYFSGGVAFYLDRIKNAVAPIVSKRVTDFRSLIGDFRKKFARVDVKEGDVKVNDGDLLSLEATSSAARPPRVKLEEPVSADITGETLEGFIIADQASPPSLDENKAIHARKVYLDKLPKGTIIFYTILNRVWTYTLRVEGDGRVSIWLRGDKGRMIGSVLTIGTFDLLEKGENSGILEEGNSAYMPYFHQTPFGKGPRQLLRIGREGFNASPEDILVQLPEGIALPERALEDISTEEIVNKELNEQRKAFKNYALFLLMERSDGTDPELRVETEQDIYRIGNEIGLSTDRIERVILKINEQDLGKNWPQFRNELEQYIDNLLSGLRPPAATQVKETQTVNEARETKTVSLPSQFDISYSEEKKLLSAIFALMPEDVRAEIWGLTTSFSYPASVRDGNGNVSPDGKVKVGACYDPLYFAEISLHELGHLLDKKLHKYLNKKDANISVGSPGLHEYTHGLLLYLLHPEDFHELTKKDATWNNVYEFYKELFNGKEYSAQDLEPLLTLMSAIRNIQQKDYSKYKYLSDAAALHRKGYLGVVGFWAQKDEKKEDFELEIEVLLLSRIEKKSAEKLEEIKQKIRDIGKELGLAEDKIEAIIKTASEEDLNVPLENILNKLDKELEVLFSGSKNGSSVAVQPEQDLQILKGEDAVDFLNQRQNDGIQTMRTRINGKVEEKSLGELISMAGRTIEVEGREFPVYAFRMNEDTLEVQAIIAGGAGEITPPTKISTTNSFEIKFEKTSFMEGIENTIKKYDDAGNLNGAKKLRGMLKTQEEVSSILRSSEFIEKSVHKIYINENDFSAKDVESITVAPIGWGQHNQVFVITIARRDGSKLQFVLKIAQLEGVRIFNDNVKTLNILNQEVPHLVPKLGAVYKNGGLEAWSEEYVNTGGMDLREWREKLVDSGDKDKLLAIEKEAIRTYYLFYKETNGGYIEDSGPGNVVIRENSEGKMQGKVIDIGAYKKAKSKLAIKDWFEPFFTPGYDFDFNLVVDVVLEEGGEEELLELRNNFPKGDKWAVLNDALNKVFAKSVQTYQITWNNIDEDIESTSLKDRIEGALRDSQFIESSIRKIHGITNLRSKDIKNINVIRFARGTQVEVYLIEVTYQREGESQVGMTKFIVKIPFNFGLLGKHNEEHYRTRVKERVGILENLNGVFSDFVPQAGDSSEEYALWSEEYIEGETLETHKRALAKDFKDKKITEEEMKEKLALLEIAVAKAYYSVCKDRNGKIVMAITDPKPQNFVIYGDKKAGIWHAKLVDLGEPLTLEGEYGFKLTSTALGQWIEDFERLSGIDLINIFGGIKEAGNLEELIKLSQTEDRKDPFFMKEGRRNSLLASYLKDINEQSSPVIEQTGIGGPRIATVNLNAEEVKVLLGDEILNQFDIEIKAPKPDLKTEYYRALIKNKDSWSNNKVKIISVGKRSNELDFFIGSMGDIPLAHFNFEKKENNRTVVIHYAELLREEIKGSTIGTRIILNILQYLQKKDVSQVEFASINDEYWGKFIDHKEFTTGNEISVSINTLIERINKYLEVKTNNDVQAPGNLSTHQEDWEAVGEYLDIHEAANINSDEGLSGSITVGGGQYSIKELQSGVWEIVNLRTGNKAILKRRQNDSEVVTSEIDIQKKLSEEGVSVPGVLYENGEFMIMEYLNGINISDIVERYPPKERLHILYQLFKDNKVNKENIRKFVEDIRKIDEMITHDDITDFRNLLIVNGRIYFIDFGIAREHKPGQNLHNAAFTIIGTLDRKIENAWLPEESPEVQFARELIRDLSVDMNKEKAGSSAGEAGEVAGSSQPDIRTVFSEGKSYATKTMIRKGKVNYIQAEDVLFIDESVGEVNLADFPEVNTVIRMEGIHPLEGFDIQTTLAAIVGILSARDNNKLKGKTVIDFGAGSGILGLLASRIAEKVIFVESDAGKHGIIESNARNNKVKNYSIKTKVNPEDLTAETVLLINTGNDYSMDDLSKILQSEKLPELIIASGGWHDKNSFTRSALENKNYKLADFTIKLLENEKKPGRFDSATGSFHEYGALVAERTMPPVETQAGVPISEVQAARAKADQGGIDFRALPITAQPMLLAGVGNRVTPGTINITNVNLDKEWQEIENMLNAGIKPSLERIREYLVLSCKDADCQAKIDQVLSGLADILRMEEESSLKTEKELKAILMLLESNKSAEQLGAELLKISIMPLEPMKI